MGITVLTVSYLVQYNTLLQNATDIIKKSAAILSQNAKNVYYKMCQVLHYKIEEHHYKLLLEMPQLLQNPTLNTKGVNTVL